MGSALGFLPSNGRGGERPRDVVLCESRERCGSSGRYPLLKQLHDETAGLGRSKLRMLQELPPRFPPSFPRPLVSRRDSIHRKGDSYAERERGACADDYRCRSMAPHLLGRIEEPPLSRHVGRASDPVGSKAPGHATVRCLCGIFGTFRPIGSKLRTDLGRWTRPRELRSGWASAMSRLR